MWPRGQIFAGGNPESLYARLPRYFARDAWRGQRIPLGMVTPAMF
jgi:hypothetical protein